MERPHDDARAASFDAFLSYSRHDDAEAKLLQSALERFARPWYRPRTSRIFLDTATMSAGGPLREAIERALESSGALILLASAASAESPWVNDELAWWLEHRGIARVVIAALEGTVPESGASAVAPSLPRALANAIGAQEHLWVDLRWMRESAEVDARDPRLTDAAAQILAALRSVPKDELVGDHLRRRRQTRRLATATVGMLTVLLLSAVVLGLVALGQRNTAVEERMTATSRQLVAQAQSLEEEQPGLARQLLLQAYRLSPSDQAVGALIRSPRLPQEMTIAGVEPEVAASPTAPVLAAVEDGQVNVRWLTSGRLLARGPPATPAAQLAFSPDGTTLAVSDDGMITLWQLTPEGTLERMGSTPLPGAGGRVVFHDEEPVLVIEGAEDLTFVVVADDRAPQVLATVPNPAVDDRLRLLGSGDLLAGPATPLPAGLPVPAIVSPLAETVDGSSILGGAVAISPDGLLLASGSGDDVVTLWDVADPLTPVLRASLVGESLGVHSLAFSSDGTALAVGTGAGIVQLWDLDDPTRPVLRERLRTRPESVDQLTFAAGSTALVAVTSDATSEDDTGIAVRRVARVWPVQHAVRTVSTIRIEGGRRARPAWDPTSRLVVAGFPARLWDVRDGAVPAAQGLLPSIPLSGGSAFAFTPDGTTMGTGSPPARWDVSDPADPVRLTSEVAVEEPAELALFGRDGALLVLSTAFGSLGLWDTTVEPARLVSQLPGSSTGTQAAVFMGGGDHLVTLAENGGALVWDVRSGSPEVVGRLSGDVASLAEQSDGSTTIVVGGSDGDLSLWDLTDPSAPEVLVQRSAHVGPVTGVAAHPDGTMLATAGEDGVRLWAWTDGQVTLMATLRAGSPFDAPALAFSPDGGFLAASSTDGTEIWDVDVDTLLGELCWESESITAEQWQEYLPDMAYDPPCTEEARAGQGSGR